MTKISYNPVSPAYMSRFVENFWIVLTLLQDFDRIKFFLTSLLTPTEIKMLAKRLQIARMLICGYKYFIIKNHVKVTAQTITRISNILSDSHNGFIEADKLLKQREEKLEKEMKERSKPYSLYKYPEFVLPGLIEESIEDAIKHYVRKKSVQNK